MTNRREFLQIGIAAASVWPLAAEADPVRAPVVAPAAARSALALYKVVYDVRFPPSAAFARRAAELGAVVHAIEGDMTRLWYDDIYRRWQQGAAAIAGFTAHGPLFCFEQLALDQGMRVALRVQHTVAPGGCVDHEISGPVGLVDDARRAVACTDWSARMAGVVMRCPGACTGMASASGRTPGAAAGIDSDSLRSTLCSSTLYSWVIAPAVRV
jgi:hypothetical protein